MMNDNLYSIKPGVQTRWASSENPHGAKGAGGKARGGRKGSAWFTLEDGKDAVLAHVENTSGIVRRIWMTINNRNSDTLRGIFIDMYWDDAKEPAVSAPIGEFFLHGIGRMAIFNNSLFSSPEGRSFNCYIPMPFRKNMKIVVRNRSGQQIKHFYYDVDYTVGDEIAEEALYFHSWFNRENPTRKGVDFNILPYLEGSGRYLGVNLGIICDRSKYFNAWWGEGEFKAFIDGDKEFPTLCGTGVEDYVGTAWGQDYYYDLYHGSQIYDQENMEIACYRLHIPDPVYFHKNIHIAIQQIGGIDTNDELNKAKFHFNQLTTGYRYRSVNGNDIDFVSIDPTVVLPELFERSDDWSCCTYFYFDKPHNKLPVLPVEECLIKRES